MDIIVDARPLGKNPTGIGRYTEEILLHLQDQIDCNLFSDKAIITRLKKVKICSSPQMRTLKCLRKSVIWQQLLLPSILQKTKWDLFWSPRHHLPLLGCKKTPMILTIHDLVYRKYPHTMKRSNWILEKLLLAASVKRANHIITISEATKQDLISELKTPEDKITVIHSGYFQPETHTEIDLKTLNINKPYILFIGTLEPRKNIERLLEAYLQLPKDLQNTYQLILAGGKGWKSETLFSKISANSDKIRYLGYVNDAEILTLLKHATCFAFPSLYEGFGLPILEAMSAGCPVLTSSDPACVEVSSNAALHVDAFSTASLADGLQTLLTNADLRQRLIKQGFENIKRFSWETAAQKHLEVFNRFAL